MTSWVRRDVAFKFQLSDWTLFRVMRTLQVRAISLVEAPPAVDLPSPPTDALEPGCQGFSIRSLPVAVEQPVVRDAGDFICYTQLQYRHYAIDLGMSFEDYKKKFSSKTRSTIMRKVKRFAEHCGGRLDWRLFRAPDEMAEFFRMARVLSARTYQEKLLDAGLPDGPDFLKRMIALAAEDRVRAYILFDRNQPVSYLYCPVHNGVVDYAYLGYDPNYMTLSVGTVLQWLALEELFAERKFRFFDFTEGQSEHKRLFATHDTLRANVVFLRRTWRNRALVRAHVWNGALSRWLGDTLDRLGVKARAKRILRFAGLRRGAPGS